jgi:hypothetical protein
MEDIPKDVARSYLIAQFKEYREALLKQRQAVREVIQTLYFLLLLVVVLFRQNMKIVTNDWKLVEWKSHFKLVEE